MKKIIKYIGIVIFSCTCAYCVNVYIDSKMLAYCFGALTVGIIIYIFSFDGWW